MEPKVTLENLLWWLNEYEMCLMSTYRNPGCAPVWSLIDCDAEELHGYDSLDDLLTDINCGMYDHYHPDYRYYP